MTFDPKAEFGVQLLADGRVRTTDRVVWTGTRGDQVEVPAGTVSDGATRPWFTAALVDRWGPATRAFLVHDVLCERLRRDQEARRAWVRQEKVNDNAMRSGRGLVTTNPLPTETAVFDAVDADGALRAIMRELGTSVVLRWMYWVAVRWAALFSSYRWGGWWRTLPTLLLWTPLVLAVMALPIAGALAGRLLLLVAETVLWPVTRVVPGRWRRGPRRRVKLGRDAEMAAKEGVERAAARLMSLTEGLLAPSQAAELLDRPTARKVTGEHGPEYVVPMHRPVPGPSEPVYVQEVRDGRPTVLRWDPARGGWLVSQVAERLIADAGPCPPGTHSNTGTAADMEIATCPRCNPDAKSMHAPTSDPVCTCGAGQAQTLGLHSATCPSNPARARSGRIARTAARWWTKARDAAEDAVDWLIDALVRIR